MIASFGFPADMTKDMHIVRTQHLVQRQRQLIDAFIAKMM